MAVWTIGATGLGAIVSVARRLGIGGFVLYLGYSLGVFVVLGAAWWAAAPGERVERIGLFTWARLIREAASDLLPFSQIGGIVVATRMLGDAGVPRPRVYASMIADMTTEMASQVVFSLFGVALVVSLLLDGGAAVSLRVPLAIGGAIMVALMIAFAAAQRWVLPLAGRIAQRVVPGSVAATREVMNALDATYDRHARIVLAFLLNLLGWVGSAAGAWVVLRLMQVPVSIWTALSIESVIFLLRSAAFAVPGGIGVQEAGYALVAPLFGLPAESALALALAKRARDLAIGIPTLLLWQAGETRAVALSARGGVAADPGR